MKTRAFQNLVISLCRMGLFQYIKYYQTMIHCKFAYLLLKIRRQQFDIVYKNAVAFCAYVMLIIKVCLNVSD